MNNKTESEEIENKIKKWELKKCPSWMIPSDFKDLRNRKIFSLKKQSKKLKIYE